MCTNVISSYTVTPNFQILHVGNGLPQAISPIVPFLTLHVDLKNIIIHTFLGALFILKGKHPLGI